VLSRSEGGSGLGSSRLLSVALKLAVTTECSIVALYQNNTAITGCDFGVGMNISDYFEKVLEAPLKNIQWSWGAENGKAVFLRSWVPEYDGHRVYVLGDRDDYGSPGYHERIQHIESIKSGMPGYVVMIEPVDASLDKWTIKRFEEKVYPIKGFEQDADECYAILDDGVEISVANGFDAEAELEALMRFPAAEKLKKAAKSWKFVANNGDEAVFKHPSKLTRLIVNIHTGAYRRV